MSMFPESKFGLNSKEMSIHVVCRPFSNRAKRVKCPKQTHNGTTTLNPLKSTATSIWNPHDISMLPVVHPSWVTVK